MFKAKTVSAALVSAVVLGSLISPSATAAPKNQARAVVQADWLEKNIDDPKVRIIEVSTEAGLYERGHIKNAFKINWYTDLVDTVKRDIVPIGKFNTLIAKAGIDKDTTVVFYGDKNNWFAAWGAWIFNQYGIEDVRLLDGGRVKWEKDARAFTTAVPTLKAGSFKATKVDRSLRANLTGDVLPVAKGIKKNVKLVDIRSADEYSGKIFAPAGFQELAVRAGHIPGAENIAWGLNVNSDGTFKTVAELKKLYADKGIDGSKAIITYCRIGERSSLTWFVLSEILGYNDVKNYDGSWTEYGNSVGAPISKPCRNNLGRTIKSKEANQASSSGLNLAAGFAWNKKEKLKTVISGLVILALLSTAYLLSSKENPGNAPISLMIGVSLGLLLERGRFCFFCIYREGIEEKNTTPFLAILVAIASGSIGYSIIFGQFLPDTSTDSLPPAAHIGPVSWPLIVAALAFGIGMSLSGACISGHLYRIGQGYLRAIPALIGVLVGFVIAFLTWNWLYLRAIADAPTIWLPHTFGYAGSLAITFLALAAIAIFAIKKGKNSEPIRSQPLAVLTPLNIYRKLVAERWSPITTGALVGVVGTFAYLRVEPLGVTRQLSTSARTLMENRNIGPDSILGLDRLAGCIAVVSETITNNGWLAIGIIGSSFAAALAGGRFKLSTLTIKNSISALLGGILLGWGSMTALGCTIGVLLSGTQAFALSGWLFFLFSFLGTLLGVKAKLHKI